MAWVRAGPGWSGLDDRDVARRIVRTALLMEGCIVSAVTTILCERWRPGVTLLPMSDDPGETYVVLGQDGRRCTVHVQKWWVRLRASADAQLFQATDVENAKPSPGTSEAPESADVVIFPPSNPSVSHGMMLQVPGIAAVDIATSAPVIGVSPVVAGAPVRGMADACLLVVRLDTSAQAVAGYYGACKCGGLLDDWLVHEGDTVAMAGFEVRSVPLMLRELAAPRALAAQVLRLAA